MQGVEQALEVIELARDSLNPDLEWLGVVFNIADMRTDPLARGVRDAQGGVRRQALRDDDPLVDRLRRVGRARRCRSSTTAPTSARTTSRSPTRCSRGSGSTRPAGGSSRSASPPERHAQAGGSLRRRSLLVGGCGDRAAAARRATPRGGAGARRRRDAGRPTARRAGLRGAARRSPRGDGAPRRARSLRAHRAARGARRAGRRARSGAETRFGGPQVARRSSRGAATGSASCTTWLPTAAPAGSPPTRSRLLREPWRDRGRPLASGWPRVRRDGRGRAPLRGRRSGAPGTPTPLGRFAVTDRLIPAPGSPYGCCILALTGRQPNLPAGLDGRRPPRDPRHADERASTSARRRAPAACASRERDLRWLMRRLPAGTRVDIKA